MNYLFTRKLLLIACFSFLSGCSENTGASKPQVQPQQRGNVPMAIGLRGAEVSISAPLQYRFETPEDAFAEYSKAVDVENYQGASQLLTKESRNAVAGALLFDLSLAMAKDDEMADRIDKLLTRFLVGEDNDSPPSKDQTSSLVDTMRTMGRTVRHTSNFIGAAIDITDGSSSVSMFLHGQLTQLETNDDTATAILISKPGSHENNNKSVEPGAKEEADEDAREPHNESDGDVELIDTRDSQSVASQPNQEGIQSAIEFRKIHGSWWVHLPDDVFEQHQD